MPDLIYFFDGGGRWVLWMAITLALCILALFLVFCKGSIMWENDPWDDAPGWGEGGQEDTQEDGDKPEGP